MRIPQIDLKREYAAIRADIDSAIDAVIESTSFVLGPTVEHFESQIVSFTGAGFAIGTSSGSTALHLALIALGVGHGDEVITTPFTFAATVEAILQCGARPVFVDVEA